MRAKNKVGLAVELSIQKSNNFWRFKKSANARIYSKAQHFLHIDIDQYSVALNVKKKNPVYLH